jgi:ribosomal-protein-alanine N-acetyltransferase
VSGAASALVLPPDEGLAPMGVADLEDVMAIEVRAYPFPWSRGNMIDSLAAGHVAWCLRGPANARRPGPLWAYLIAMTGVEETHLLNITVSPEHQGAGHATRLMRALAAAAVARGDTQLWLEVRPSNERARRLYAHLGFEQVGLRRGYYPDAGSRREDALVLRRRLDPRTDAWTATVPQTPAEAGRGAH